MSGRRLVQGFLVFLVVFVAALIWTQFFAYYHRVTGIEALDVAGRDVPVSGYQGIDGTSSPLKLRGCMLLETSALMGLPPAVDAAPLTAPFWFRCFDARQLGEDIASGAATAYAAARDTPEGFDRMLAVYPDGRAYLWRQLNARYSD